MTFEMCYFLEQSMSPICSNNGPDSCNHWVDELDDLEVSDGWPVLDHCCTKVGDCAGQRWAGAQALFDDLPDRFDRIEVWAAGRPAEMSDTAYLELLLGAPGWVDMSIVLNEA